MPKELPCPHCGQDIHIPARYNAAEVSRLERIKEKVEKFRLADWEFRGGHQPTAWMELCDALKAEEER